MSHHQQHAVDHAGLPPIVLFVDDDADTLEMYATYFQSSGMWVCTANIPGDALRTADELRPDVVVTDIRFGAGFAPGADLVRALRTSDLHHDTRVIVLSGLEVAQLPSGTEEAADLCLVKPVRPDALLAQVERLAFRVNETPAPAAEGASRRAWVTEDRLANRRRRCPRCSGALAWTDRGRLGGAQYDYYRECANGCGLYCYDCASTKWLKLA
jgi:DNA-binding response OmpR family regulator